MSTQDDDAIMEHLRVVFYIQFRREATDKELLQMFDMMKEKA